MARTQLRAGDGEGFLRAFHDAVRDLELAYSCTVSCSLGLTGRKGVLLFELTARSKREGANDPVIGKYTCEYPTAQVGTLEAALYASAVRLERVVADWDTYPAGR
jgi:hypothetical protein